MNIEFDIGGLPFPRRDVFYLVSVNTPISGGYPSKFKLLIFQVRETL